VGAIYWLCILVRDYARNPGRPLYEVVGTALLLPIVGFVIASVAQIFAYIIFSLCAVALVVYLGRVPLIGLLLLTPFLGLLTWYGYDHFVPDFRLMTDPSPPYEHGLTLERFLKAWGFEALIALGYWWPLRRVRVSIGAAA